MTDDEICELSEWEIRDIMDDRDRLYDENQRLLQRLHQCKRRNREDKVKLRRGIDELRMALISMSF